MVDDDSATFASRARINEISQQTFADSLAGHFDEPQFGDIKDLGAGLVTREGALETVKHLATILSGLHVDEVDNDDSADISQPQLPRDFICRLKIIAEHGFF